MCKELEQVVAMPEGTVVAEYEPLEQSRGFQTEADLENEFIQTLVSQGYEYADIHDEAGMVQNLRKQMEALNGVMFSDAEWDRFFHARFDRGAAGDELKRIQEGTTRENFVFDDGHDENLILLDKQDLMHNKMQVIHQYVAAGGDNRYDVSILVNGLPLVHFELKRRGIDIREAYRQISRYKDKSFSRGLYRFVQILVVSNGSFTRYFGDRVRHIGEMREEGFEYTNVWADSRNLPIHDLIDFARTFCSKRTLLSVLTKYCVLDRSRRGDTEINGLKVMRAYQIAACEAVINKIKNEAGMGHFGRHCGGYIWHTTGSGKTLTSFKVAQQACELDCIDKVLFIVDRNDLDSQTAEEYKKFAGGDDDFVSETKNMVKLGQNLKNPNAKIVVTTIQKLDGFVRSHSTHSVYDLRVALIFDECHRSQFGDMHHRITSHFKKHYAFGFTGTPIFEENAVKVTAVMLAHKTGKASSDTIDTTTDGLFGDCLHKYLITDAIRDGTVLKFKLTYLNTASAEDGVMDGEDSGINASLSKTAMNWDRIRSNSAYILDNFDTKTHHKQQNRCNSILACESVEAACRYYHALKEMIDERGLDIKMGIIYTYAPNSEILEGLGVSKEEFLRQAMLDYSKMFGGSYDTANFGEYKNSVSRKMKNVDGMLDLLVVADMFLTGFDSKYINTLWVDKPLEYHSLLQAFSRTNRRYGDAKDCGQIVCFRNLKDAVKDAIAMFASQDVSNILLIRPYGDYYDGYTDENGRYHTGYRQLVERLLKDFDYSHMTRDPVSDNAKRNFVELFGQILVARNILATFDEFKNNEIFTEQQFDDYKALYIGIHNETRTTYERAAGELDGLVFHVDLIEETVMNIDAILLAVQQKCEESGQALDAEFVRVIQRQLDASPQLHSKKLLMDAFLAQVNNGGDSSAEAWVAFVADAFRRDLEAFVAQEKLQDGAEDFIEDAVENGFVQESGTKLDEILPHVSRFGGNRAAVRDRVIDGISKIVEEYNGIISFHEEDTGKNP